MHYDIHSIERRGDLEETRKRIVAYCVKPDAAFYPNDSFNNLILKLFPRWKYKKGALSIPDYFADIGLKYSMFTDVAGIHNYSDNEILYYIIFIVEMIFFVKKMFRSDSINIWLESLISTIASRLELSNYRIEANNDQYIICKRDANVDSVLPLINKEETQLYILEYLDFRTQNNIERKREILYHLFKYWEDNKKDLEETRVTYKNNKTKEISPTDAFAMICNTYDVRHFPQELKKANDYFINIPVTEADELCDIAFYMFIEAVRIPEIHKMRLKLAEYNGKYEKDDRFSVDKK